MRSIDKIIVVACGTAAYAGHVAKYAIEHWCRIPVEIELAHEFNDQKIIDWVASAGKIGKNGMPADFDGKSFIM